MGIRHSTIMKEVFIDAVGKKLPEIDVDFERPVEVAVGIILAVKSIEIDCIEAV